MKKLVALSCAGLLTVPVLAADLSLKVEIPALTVAEYHRPYLAVWLEGGEPAQTTQLAVWYDQKKKDHAGLKWLKDLRQWWRKGGRDVELPLDAVSSATRAPGVHALHFVPGRAPLGTLAPGSYTLFVEAAREGGGREVVRLPFAWPPRAAQTVSARGQEELATLTLTIKP